MDVRLASVYESAQTTLIVTLIDINVSSNATRQGPADVDKVMAVPRPEPPLGQENSR